MRKRPPLPAVGESQYLSLEWSKSDFGQNRQIDLLLLDDNTRTLYVVRITNQKCWDERLLQMFKIPALSEEGDSRKFATIHAIILGSIVCTGLGKRVVPRLRELTPRGQREPGGGIRAILLPSPVLGFTLSGILSSHSLVGVSPINFRGQVYLTPPYLAGL